MKNYSKSAEDLFADTSEQEEEIIELTDVVDDPGGLHEEIIELTDIVAEPPTLADTGKPEFIDLTEELFPIDQADETELTIDLSDIDPSAETAHQPTGEDEKFYEPIDDDDIVALVDQISSQLDPNADDDDLPIEALDDDHVVELIDLNEEVEVDSANPEPTPFTIPLDEMESSPDITADGLGAEKAETNTGMPDGGELDFETMDELTDALGEALDTLPDRDRSSEAAEQLEKQMQAEKLEQAEEASAGDAGTDDEFSLTLDSIRNKLDSVFPDDETTALPDAMGWDETSAQGEALGDEADLAEPLFPEPVPETQPAEALLPESESPVTDEPAEAQITPSFSKTVEPTAEIPEILFPEEEFDPDMPQFTTQDLNLDLEPDMPESMLREAELTPDVTDDSLQEPELEAGMQESDLQEPDLESDLAEPVPAVASQPDSAVSRMDAERGMQLESMVVSSMVRAMGAPTDRQIEAALEHVIKTMYGDKIEQLIIEVIEKTVAKEIRKIKQALLDESDLLT